jgi:hypothetical protein
MRKSVFAVALLFLAGMSLALSQAPPAQAPPAPPQETKGKTHEVTVDVISTDLTAMTMTIKGEDGQDKTVPVKKSALEGLKKVKAGDKVILTCQDNEKGEHEAITAIRLAKS